MRILYDSKKTYHKSPFGCLRQDEKCRLRIDVPTNCQTESVRLYIFREDGFNMTVPLDLERTEGDYQTYGGEFALYATGLYFYYFKITTANESFDLYKQGSDTNIAVGDMWQVTCFDKSYDTPREFKGRVMYQIFPDRFNKSGEADLSGKLQPYYIHEDSDDVPVYLPNENGKIINNDFFGGNLNGIREKLPYLKELGVGIIYLNPIFKAYSNHRYDTADYKKIDPLLGTEADFEELCRCVHDNGMKLILDGVFSHTGSNSVYFDKERIFGGGAYSDPNSRYRSWFKFEKYPDKYDCWWGIVTLPCVDELNADYMDYIISSDDSVIAHWLRLGADGFRLDVADELPDEFIAAFKKRLLELKPDALLIGEVWEDASNKVSYGSRRKYFSASELDSVMNYPFRDAILSFVGGGIGGAEFENRVMTIAENYPKPVLDCVMNLLSTHDTVRVLTQLSGVGGGMSKSEKANFKLSPSDFKRVKSLEVAAAVLQFTLPGNPCIYYGDEIGMQGFEDPLNRAYFKWDDIDAELHGLYASLSRLKNESEVLRLGDIAFVESSERYVKFVRSYGEKSVCVELSLCDALGSRDGALFEYRGGEVNAVVFE